MGEKIRNAVRAIIIKDNHILLCEYHNEEGYYYVTPGGGQEFGEDMKSALQRECSEELGVDVIVNDIVFVRDAMFQSRNSRGILEDHHQVEYFFTSTIIGDREVHCGDFMDSGQTGVKWIPLQALQTIRIYPREFNRIISEDGTFDGHIYIGVSE